MDRMPLSIVQKRSFRRNGFLVLPDFSPPAEVMVIRQVLEGLFSRQIGRSEGDLLDFAAVEFDPARPVMPQLLRPVRYAAELAETAFRTRAQLVARHLLGPDAAFQFDHAIVKPPRDGCATPWHQDIAFHPPEDRHRNLTIWMALQDVDERNGCLRYLPGSHRGRLYSHRPIGGDARLHGLEAIDVTAADPVAAPLPAGGVVVHDSRTLHGAGPNLSEAPRWSYAAVFRRPGRGRLHGWRYGPLLSDPLASFLRG